MAQKLRNNCLNTSKVRFVENKVEEIATQFKTGSIFPRIRKTVPDCPDFWPLHVLSLVAGKG